MTPGDTSHDIHDDDDDDGDGDDDDDDDGAITDRASESKLIGL